MCLESIVKWSSLLRRKPAVLLPVLTVACLLYVPAGASAQTPGTAANRAQVWTRAAIDQQFAGMAGTAKAKGSTDGVLGIYDGHAVRLSSRTASGQVEVHNHFVDVIFVVKGQVTLLTGGTVVGGKPGDDGEIRGTSMRGGVRHTISAGDVVHIPAGVPHQMLLQPGTLFEAEIVKVRVAGK